MIENIHEVLKIAHKHADNNNIEELKSFKKKFQDEIDQESFDDSELEKRYYLLECVYQIQTIIDSLDDIHNDNSIKKLKQSEFAFKKDQQPNEPLKNKSLSNYQRSNVNTTKAKNIHKNMDDITPKKNEDMGQFLLVVLGIFIIVYILFT